MGLGVSNRRCPKHSDQTPSLRVYSNGGYCFAGCGFIPLSDLGLKASDVENEERYIEDVEETLRMVDGLPKDSVRGFLLPHSPQGYYLVWPDRSYYKLRLYNGKPKYKGPSGCSTPPFWVRQSTSSTLLVVEGEFDALSVALAVPEWDVMSPGSTANFSRKLLPSLKPYSNIIIIADDDPAGIKAVIDLGGLIYAELPGIPFRKILKASGGADFNDIHVNFGINRLREEVIRLSTNLQGQDSRCS